jgi:hypothetical protein
MITKIALKNFMSHVDTVLELGPGLTVVTGPNNCGKSALVAALQLVCRNHLGDLVVRHGAKECTVTLWTDDPHEITWRRKGKDVSYTIDGTDHSRLKGKPPEILHNLLKLPEIEEGDETFDLHFALQKDPIFLLDEAGSKAAKFFASSSDAARLMEMQGLHKRRTQDRKSKLRTFKEQEGRLLGQIEWLQGIDPLRVNIDQLSQDHQVLMTTLNSEAVLAEESQRLLNQACEVDLHSQRLAILNALPVVPAVTPTDSLEEWLQEAQRAQDQIHYQSERATLCRQLAVPPVLPDDHKLAECVTVMSSAQSQANVLTLQSKWFGQLTTPPKLSDESPLGALVSGLGSRLAQITKAQVDLNDAQEGEDKSKLQLKRWMKQHPECPVCRRPWKDAAALVGGHTHG